MPAGIKVPFTSELLHFDTGFSNTISVMNLQRKICRCVCLYAHFNSIQTSARYKRVLCTGKIPSFLHLRM